jgi:serine/threonine protein kinase
LLDFGIASRIESTDETKLTRTGALAGTPLFMAPEIVRGMLADARTDLYGLGATMYFLLTGTPPFNGDLRAVMLAHVLDTPEPPSMRGVQIPAKLEQIVMRCLAKQPDERFQSAAQLAAALDDAECGLWTPRDAQRFWEQERVGTLARWAEPTMTNAMTATQQ